MRRVVASDADACSKQTCDSAAEPIAAMDLRHWSSAEVPVTLGPGAPSNHRTCLADWRDR